MAGDHQLSFVGTIQAVAELPGELTRGLPAALAASSSWDAEPRGVPADPGSDRWRVLTEWSRRAQLFPRALTSARADLAAPCGARRAGGEALTPHPSPRDSG